VNRIVRRVVLAAPVFTVAALFGPGSGSALAASSNPASDQYGGGGVLGEAAGGSLPFTGVNLIVLLGLGFAMVAIGLAVRRGSDTSGFNSSG
jgi:hypothetical protein